MDEKTQCAVDPDESHPIRARRRSRLSQRTRAILTQAHMAGTLLPLSALILIDQLTKLGAERFAPSVRHSMAAPNQLWSIARYLHAPNAFTDFTALGAIVVVSLLCWFPVPKTVKVLWLAAGLSNNVEMLLRPGTMDFLAFRFWGMVCIANVADLYFAAGFVPLIVWVVRRVRQAKTWFEPV
jgi:lipoprotein signal peptidase